MKDVSGKIWEYSKDEKYVFKWLEKHGFDFEIRKRYISKDIIHVSKDGIDFDFHLPLGDEKINYSRYMKLFENDFELRCEYERLKRGL